MVEGGGVFTGDLMLSEQRYEELGTEFNKNYEEKYQIDTSKSPGLVIPGVTTKTTDGKTEKPESESAIKAENIKPSFKGAPHPNDTAKPPHNTNDMPSHISADIRQIDT